MACGDSAIIGAMREPLSPSATTLAESPLGKPTDYPERYDPSLLFGVERAPQRKAIGLSATLSFDGVDLWTAYELSWLNPIGRPQCALLDMAVPASSPAIVESKSLKLYLGSFAQTACASGDEVAGLITNDVSRVCGAAVSATLVGGDLPQRLQRAELQGESIDDLDISIDRYVPSAQLLSTCGNAVDESLRSSLFKSNCPVTGQPDYADILVRYSGPRIDRASLLRYLVSYREHAAFHESCVERIFVDIMERCAPKRLTVYARFLRRGGIDINPFRSNFEAAPARPLSTPRQ